MEAGAAATIRRAPPTPTAAVEAMEAMGAEVEATTTHTIPTGAEEGAAIEATRTAITMRRAIS
jgi:hypothetical protein